MEKWGGGTRLVPSSAAITVWSFEKRDSERGVGRGTGADLPNDENGQKEGREGMMGKRVLVGGGGVFNTSDNSCGFLLRRRARKIILVGVGK